MLNKKVIEFIVGLFILAGVVSLFILAFQVSGISDYSQSNTFRVTALFDNIGDLKVRAPVTLAGVRVGEVANITLDPKTFKADVVLRIDKRQNQLPVDTSASIFTAGLIGANYISLSPGFAEKTLTNGSVISDTHPALVLENLIGQFIYRMGKDDKDNNDNSGNKSLKDNPQKKK